MSQENVEIVRQLFEAVNRRDATTVLALYDPNVEVDSSRDSFFDVLGRGVYHGHDGLRRFWREWYTAWESVENDCEELIDAGEHVITVVTTRGRGRGSGIELERPFVLLWTLRECKIVRVVWFRTRQEALEAVGPRE